MVNVTRKEYRIVKDWDFESNWPLLVVRYEVEDESRRLVVSSEIDPRSVDDQAVIDAMLVHCDGEAHWSAAHPDQVPEAKLRAVEI